MRSRLRAGAILALTIGLLAFFLRNADLAGVWAEMRSADPVLFGLATLVTLTAYLVRAVRWQTLLAPLGRVHFWTAFRTTVIGFAASVILPARAGEILRPYLLARREGLSTAAAFATVVVERFLDLATVLLLLGGFLLFFDPGIARQAPGVFAAVRAGGLAAALGALGGLSMLFVLAGHPDWLRRWAERLERLLPGRAAGAVDRVLRLFTQGLATVRQPRRLLAAFVWSVPLWLVIAVGIWLATLAFHMTVPFTGTFLMIALLVVGVAVPTPGAIGGFHTAFQVAATHFYGVPNDRAIGGAIVLHAISFVPVMVLGAAFMLHDGLTLSRVRALAGGGLDPGAPHQAEDEVPVGAVDHAESLR
jgi:uncharacterized protein (TIRG00374 family)